ncbi:hypothetical protein FGO68_gene3847 [Halteria grandinella]|uniref:Lariat debranching enzyme C-terminal domain-containing protein n=1 Tax=Halteria grandinella TaxID=5974 RepID=A0A8J8T2E0_HALGN|nr:hypothetical protein FGO68_gene3847 [Halteria grandinella]
MIVAVVGCLHGKLEFLYEELAAWELKTGQKVDFIICAGDFQSLRNGTDMQAMECPDKYKEIGQFQSFYKRELRAPILTLFVGGNHEASNLLRDLYYGGWVAENIYYLGSSGVVTVLKGEEKVRVGGISGIEKHYDYLKGYCERWPYVSDKDGLRSIYHIRQFDVQKLKMVGGPVDIMVSHEWPTSATNTARKDQIQYLTRFKPHFQNDIRNNQLGSRNLSDILDELKPSYWFSAHLHVKFNTLIPHTSQQSHTEFLSLDKPLPRRQYLDVFEIKSGTGQKLKSLYGSEQVFKKDQYPQQQKFVYKPKQQYCAVEDVPEESKQEGAGELQKSDVQLCYDPEWVAILKATQTVMPLEGKRYDFRYLTKGHKASMEQITEHLEPIKGQDLSIPFNPEKVYTSKYERVHPQTQVFLERFGIDKRLFDPDAYFDSQLAGEKRSFVQAFEAQKVEQKVEQPIQEPTEAKPVVKDDNEIDLDDI